MKKAKWYFSDKQNDVPIHPSIPPRHVQGRLACSLSVLQNLRRVCISVFDRGSMHNEDSSTTPVW